MTWLGAADGVKSEPRHLWIGVFGENAVATRKEMKCTVSHPFLFCQESTRPPGKITTWRLMHARENICTNM